MTKLRFIIFVATILVHQGCTKLVSPDKIQSEVSQIPGCQPNQSLQSSVQEDSCFTYSFGQSLVVDFCVTGNCCPDSNRFASQCDIRQDTIEVTIADTAAKWCRCICTYVLHAEFHDLPRDRYLFLCKKEEASGDSSLYSVQVYRTQLAS